MIEKTEADIMKGWKGDLSTPVASICVRTYNLERFVEEALDSLLMQETDFPYEIVVDDDCSTDGTADIVKAYREKFPHIINANLLKKNIGVRMNFIKNMQRARGKYIAPCDGDDYWTDPLKLQKQVDFLEEHDEYVVCYTAMEPFFEKGATQREFVWNTEDKDAEEIQKNFVGTGICAMCFRNVDIIQNYPFEHHCAPIDDNFFASMLGAYGKGKFLGDIKASRYRHHGGGDYTSKSRYEKSKMYYQTFFALYMYYLRIGKDDLSAHFHKKALEHAFVLHGRSYYIEMLWESFKKDRKISLLKNVVKKIIKKSN
jgi:glycosyltransferase involved in cell wall biosynthesis